MLPPPPGPLLLAALDVAFGSLVVAPAVVSYWRGAWMLLDSVSLPWWASLGAGQAGLLLCVLLQRPAPQSPSLCWTSFSRLYTAVLGVCCVASWRGAWRLLDEHGGGLEWRYVASSTAASVAALAALRALRNLLAPPTVVTVDKLHGYFDVPTLFRLDRSVHGALWVLDCLFSVLVVGNLVVFVWRGAWTMLDLYLYPEHEAWSALASLVLGYSVVVASFCLQFPLFLLVGRLQGLCRLLVADVYHTVAFFGTVNVWRGIWNLLNLFLLPGNPDLSYWSSLVVSMAILMLLGCANSILVRGVFIDGEEPGGRCVIFPCRYLRVFCKKNPKKKDGKRPAEEMAIAANHVVVTGNVMDLPETIL